MSALHLLTIHYHRDFDGMVAAAVLAHVLRDRFQEEPAWRSVNYDQRTDWENFERGRRFAVVDFHFHPRAEYWFDHHPTRTAEIATARTIHAVDGAAVGIATRSPMTDAMPNAAGPTSSVHVPVPPPA